MEKTATAEDQMMAAECILSQKPGAKMEILAELTPRKFHRWKEESE